MKNAFKLSGALLALYASGSAEFQVGNGAIQLDTSLTGVYDSNLRASVNNISDYYLNFTPSLRYRRIGARFNTEASTSVQFKRFLDHHESNADDVSAQFGWDMRRTDGYTTGASLAFGYIERSDAVVEVNERVNSSTFFVNTAGEILVAGRNLFTAGLSYSTSRRNFGSDQMTSSGRVGYSFLGFTDGTVININYSNQKNKSEENIEGITVLDQTVDTGIVTVSHPIYVDFTGSAFYGYRHLDRGTQEFLLGRPNRSGPIYGISFDGPFLPKKYFSKTTGTFRLAYEQAQAPGLNDSGNERLVGQIDLAWTAREKTVVHFVASRSQNLSIDDNTVVNERTELFVSQGIGSFINTNFGVAYTNATFVNLERNDDRYEAHADATYRINRDWSSTIGYRYLHSESTAIFANYQRHVVSGTINYAF